MDEIIFGLEDMLYSIDNPLKNFKKDTYETMFKNYLNQHSKTLESVKNEISESETNLEIICDTFVSHVSNKVQQISKKREVENTMMDYNLILVAYFIPAFLESDKTFGTSFSNQMILSWKKYFPRTNLNVATFEEINSGFKKRYCYITTAVCESLGKPDDCYELTLLRNYRDNYLLNEQDGEQLIRCYYDIAPSIVKHIGQETNSHEIYVHIWNKYLNPCIKAIENGDNEHCKELYTNMVYELQDEYFILA